MTHTSEIPYVYGITQVFDDPPAAANLSTRMIDYWVSFVTSLDPNDGLGSERPTWSQYTSDQVQHILQLNSGNTTMISDDFRSGQIAFINSHAVVFSV
ncbi:hypothetical protein DFH07DRAFT_736885 [Mycena maculata]|uniref:Carboxylesterase type B domain-containing protein n=1 Tax=Mycena maculata TaxID=230809 RepID=A0AAD7JPI7_9AGAR|nr:hypothetical protein DFH07DRAFT_736885 [Mycena maculata]